MESPPHQVQAIAKLRQVKDSLGHDTSSISKLNDVEQILVVTIAAGQFIGTQNTNLKALNTTVLEKLKVSRQDHKALQVQSAKMETTHIALNAATSQKLKVSRQENKDLRAQSAKMETMFTRMEARLDHLEKDNVGLGIRVYGLEAENFDLKKEITDLKQENVGLGIRVCGLEAENFDLKKDNAEFRAEITDLKQENVDLKATVEMIQGDNAQHQMDITNLKATRELTKYLIAYRDVSTYLEEWYKIKSNDYRVKQARITRCHYLNLNDSQELKDLKVSKFITMIGKMSEECRQKFNDYSSNADFFKKFLDDIPSIPIPENVPPEWNENVDAWWTL